MLNQVSAPPQIDTGLACLVMLARFHSIAVDPHQIAHEFKETGKLFGVTEILLASKKLGLVTKKVKPQLARLATTPMPAIALAKDGSFFIIARMDGDKVLIHDPCVERPEIISQEDLAARWAGDLLLFTSRASLAGELAKFDFSWFVPAIVKYRKLLLEVLLVSFVLQFFGLVTPLFFQVVMDKVLVHKGFSTLDVIAFAFVVVVIFEVVLTTLRSYVFAHTTSRIDVELGAKL
ncbi:MAG TPA: cysteine peptidase family C39 domain-containing protein, partial [Agitococcus sp.]|nr:cysteine peptidase family C39 domain-containing protein [Agitococcus sp.]